VTDTPKILVGSVWRHRNGTMYVVRGLANIEKGCVWAVVYEGISSGICWVLPVLEFIDGRYVLEVNSESNYDPSDRGRDETLPRGSDGSIEDGTQRSEGEPQIPIRYEGAD